MSSCSANVILLTETWLHTDIADSEIFPDHPDLRIYRCDRSGRRGGGALIGVTGGVISRPVSIFSRLEAVWVSIQCSFKHVLLGVYYRPPDADSSFSDYLQDDLSALTAAYPTYPIILFGDFNFPTINWHDSLPFCSKGTQICRNFIDVCLGFNLRQLVSLPTRVSPSGSSILDLVLTTNPELIVQPLSCFDGVSDHKALHCCLNIQPPKPVLVKKKIRLYDKGNYEQINFCLSNYFSVFNTGFSSRSVNENWCLFKNKIAELVDTFIPCASLQTSSSNPWFTRHLRSLANKKKRLFRVAKRAETCESWRKYYDCAKMFKTDVRESKMKFLQITLPSILVSNPRRFWNVVNPNQEFFIKLISDLGDIVPDTQCAAVLNNVFSNVFTLPVNACPTPLPPSDYFPMDPIFIDFNGVANIINCLKISSSCGIDNINSKLLRNTNLSSSLFLTKIFQQSLDSGVVPDDWKIGKVIPVHKNGSKSSPLNYRPISLTSIPSKIMEHVIFKHLSSFLEDNSFFNDAQHGFRRNFSCETQLLLLTNDLSLNIDTGHYTIAVFLDFAKAFDKVSHELLLLKLYTLKIDPNVLQWIESFLSDRCQFVHANNTDSHLCPVTSGVPQGTVLGPLLFLIYINDLPLNISSTIRLFADDCVIYQKITSQAKLLELQNDLVKITDWCDKWKMSLNINKCRCMRFSGSPHGSRPTLFLNGTPLEYTNQYKYLGLHLTPNLSWKTHIEQILLSANRSLGYVRRNFRSAPTNLRRLLYITLIRPKLEYASSIWHPHHVTLTDSIESFQNRAARFIVADYSRFSSVTSIKTNLGLPELSLRRRISRLSLFHKVFYTPSLKQSLLSPPAYTSARLDHSCKVARPQCSSEAHRNAFLSAAITDWNYLPEAIVSNANIQQFRKTITNYFCLYPHSPL